MNTIFICEFCACILFGAIYGFCRKYSNISFWGGTVLFTLFVVRIAGDKTGKGSEAYVLTVLLVAVLSLILLTLLFEAVRISMKKGEEKRKKLSYYRHYDEEEENKELILDAVDRNDKKAYAKLSKKKFKQSGGVSSVVNRVFGLITGAVNALVANGALICVILTIADLSSAQALIDFFSESLTSDTWVNLGAPWTADLILIILLCASIRIGYNSGISSAACTLFIIGLVALAGYGAYAFAFGSGADSFANGISSSLLASVTIVDDSIKLIIARCIITAIAFLILLVFVIIAGIFLPKLIDKWRESKGFTVADGVLGAMVFCAFIMGLLFAVFGLTYQFSSIEAMGKANSYLTSSHISDCMYTYNPLSSFFDTLPIKGWLGGSTETSE